MARKVCNWIKLNAAKAFGTARALFLSFAFVGGVPPKTRDAVPRTLACQTSEDFLRREYFIRTNKFFPLIWTKHRRRIRRGVSCLPSVVTQDPVLVCSQGHMTSKQHQNFHQKCTNIWGAETKILINRNNTRHILFIRIRINTWYCLESVGHMTWKPLTKLLPIKIFS